MTRFYRADSTDIDHLVEQRIAFFRDMHPGDKDFIDSYRGPLRAYYSETIPTGECVYWLAAEDDRIVGGGGYALRRYAPSLTLPDGTSGYVFNIFTDSQYRRRGIARKIILHLMEEARKQGLRRLDLHATEAGRPLYEEIGFRAPDQVYLEWALADDRTDRPST